MAGGEHSQAIGLYQEPCHWPANKVIVGNAALSRLRSARVLRFGGKLTSSFWRRAILLASIGRPRRMKWQRDTVLDGVV